MKKNSFKELYSFTVLTEVERDSTEVREENGEKITITKKVVEKTPVKVVLKKPTRQMIDEAEMQQAIKMSECIKKNIVTKAMLTKKYADTGGVLSETEAKEHMKRYKDLSDYQIEWVRLSVKKDLTEEENERLHEINMTMNELRRKIAQVESSYSTLFENTADVISMKAQILFYTLMLTHVEKTTDKGVEYTPLFAGETYEDKIASYYELEEDSTDLYLKARSKIVYFISFWVNGVISDRDGFVELEKDIDEGKV